MSALSNSNRGASPEAGSLARIPSMNSKVWLASAPRIRTSVSEPAGPKVEIEADGARRSRAGINGSPSRSIRLRSMMTMLAGERDCCSGAREAVMTIWLVSIGSAGMLILLLTNLSSQRAARPTPPRLVPAGETDDGPRQVPDFPRIGSGVTVAGTAPDFRRLPFEPPPPSFRSWAAPWSLGSATWTFAGLSNCARRYYAAAHDDQLRPRPRAPLRNRRRHRAAPGATSAQFHADRGDGAVQRGLSRAARCARVRCAAGGDAAQRRDPRFPLGDAVRLCRRGADRPARPSGAVAADHAQRGRRGDRQLAAVLRDQQLRDVGGQQLLPAHAGGAWCLLCRRRPVLPEHDRRRPVLLWRAVRRIRAHRARRPGA